MGNNACSIHIGTSGWSYNHWKGTFYPAKIKNNEMLAHYARAFHTVEINSTFYGLPSEKSLRHWKDSVPDDFLFAVKASRYLTHFKKLADPKPGIQNLIGRIRGLDEKLGPILFQLPPGWHRDRDRLAACLNELPKRYRYVFEFRDETWFSEDIISLLEQEKVACCIYDLEGQVSPIHSTTDFIYVRLHGPGAAYQGSYSRELLEQWGERFKTWLQENRTIYCYFNNDYEGHAPRNAKLLMEMISEFI